MNQSSHRTALASAPEPLLLIIADISGYTRYMTANSKTLAHSQTIITELIHALVQEIELPLEVAKLEGDAIFLFCRKNSGAISWMETRRVVAEKLLAFFRQFSARLDELGGSTTCTCNACTHIEKLQLKVVVHSGEALFHRVLIFTELAGVDVIIAHRLLKNSVKADQYLLLTEAARHDLEFSETISFADGSETYEDLGHIKTLTYLPAGATLPTVAARLGFAERFKQSWKLFFKLWFAPFAARAGLFSHVTSEATAAGRFIFALLTGLLTPFYLPIGTLFVFFHALNQPVKAGVQSAHHKHKSDGSCCGK